jgi:hypothetical protein
MPPILYVIFNRPELTRQSFANIRQARPSVLYVAADAPRLDRVNESELTEQARQVTNQIDWDCDVRRLYATHNMGCGRRISSAITEVLQDFESVIVLEDDCIVEPTFFRFCSELLHRYADDERVMAVSGDNFQKGVSRTAASYYFSKYPHCWGWGTWRRAWQHFSLTIQDWPEFRDSGGLETYCQTDRELRFWKSTFDLVYQGKLDSWAMPWTFCCWKNHGLTILPNKNLVSNVGFGVEGTHTYKKSAFAELPTDALEQIVHPTSLYRHDAADRFTDELVYSGPWDRALKKRNRRRWFPRPRDLFRAAA